ncbi:hypothetical protein D3C79_1033380 [compost metagenome]
MAEIRRQQRLEERKKQQEEKERLEKEKQELEKAKNKETIKDNSDDSERVEF